LPFPLASGQIILKVNHLEAMNIAKDHIVSLDYTLTDDTGNVIDASRGAPLSYLHGARNIIPGLETALEGLVIGAERKVTVPPAEGYGEYDETLVMRVPADRMGGHAVQVGMRFHAETNAGLRVLTVKEVKGDEVVLDGNHELAGKTLHFAVKITEVRPATPTELAHGHPHQEASGCCGGGGQSSGGCCGGGGGESCSTEASAETDDQGCCGGQGKAASEDGSCGKGSCGCSN
jgi:FKBP-type peptidyl-prolyl cis-trans isomerase SlyD